MTGFYLFVSSEDSKTYHTDNTYHDFVVELGRTYDLDENSYIKNRSKWSMALVEIKLEAKSGNEPVDQPELKDEVLIICDLVTTSYVKGTEARVLRPLGLNDKALFATISQAYYIELNRLNFSRFKITILDKNLNKLSKKNGWPIEAEWKLSCTLHFQKI